jgi:hypothetical protein
MPRLSHALFALILLAQAAGLRADYWRDAWLDPALLEAVTLSGGSGFVHVPAPQSLPNGQLAAGLHAYRVAAERGFPYGLEVGLQMELDGLDQDGDWHTLFQRQLFNARWTPLPPERFGVGISAGVEGVSLGDLGFNVQNLDFLPSQVRPGPAGEPKDPDGAMARAMAQGQARHLGSLQALQRQYVELGGPLPRLPMAYAVLGVSGGRIGPPEAFGALAVAPFAGSAVFLEYDRGTNVGLRLLFSTQIKMDLAVSDLQSLDWGQPFDLVMVNNVRFGISYSEPWP